MSRLNKVGLYTMIVLLTIQFTALVGALLAIAD